MTLPEIISEKDVMNTDLVNYPSKIYSWNNGDIKCTMKRNLLLKHWCGYIKLPNNHPDLNLDIDQIDSIYNFYGGMTAYWGFDCSHYYNLLDSFSISIEKDIDCKATFKTFEFVQREVNRLADIANKRRLLEKSMPNN